MADYRKARKAMSSDRPKVVAAPLQDDLSSATNTRGPVHRPGRTEGTEGIDDDSHVDQRAWRVDAAGHGQRLDKVLVAGVPEFSRSHLQALIALGAVQVDGQTADLASRKLRVGQSICVDLVPTAQSQAFRPEPMAIDVVHEDDEILVVDKPAGLVVHPAAGHWHGTLLNGLLAAYPQTAELPRAGIVHRLDKDTSGLMVVAKTLAAMTGLVRAMAAREVRREYLAIAHRAADQRTFSIDAAVGRDPVSRTKMALRADGKPARTDVERVAIASIDGEVHSLLRCRLHTGRTHQIRVHLASRGHPLVGDASYGGWPALGMRRQALHAWQLAFAHPATARTLSFERAPPADFAAAWDLCLAHATGIPTRAR